MNKPGIFQDLVPALRRVSWVPSSVRNYLLGEDKSIEELSRLMMESEGEYSSYLIADRVLSEFERLDDDGAAVFFDLLNTSYDLDVERIGELGHQYAQSSDPLVFEQLLQAAEPQRQKFLQRLNMAPEGTLRLVKMREKLRRVSRDNPDLKKMDVDFRRLLTSWFNPGFLSLKPITWNSPAHILEKIIAYEAVHEIGSWRELKQRLQPEDRRCYAFFHPAMADEPLVFVEVALMDAVPRQIEEILGSERHEVGAERATAAIFYSISNCHKGLSGVSFGNFLIKHVANHLKSELHQLKTFATLSPVPGLVRWIETSESDDADGNLENLAARFLVDEKNDDHEPLDPVARFHLRNGARLERINLNANQSELGVSQSRGVMVNYTYDLSTVEENHEKYVHEKFVSASPSVRKLANTR
ncbi:MAG: malonyl-CoA decarboxylase family protein [Pseudomonadota bacterium]